MNYNPRDLLDRYGPDEEPSGTVLIWSKVFEEDGKEYEYAAVKANGQWYVTGQSKKYKWAELLYEFENDNLIDGIAIYRITEVEPIFEEE